MRKLIVLIMLLAVSAVASAVTVELQAPAQAMKGDIVNVKLFTDFPVTDVIIIGISDNGAGGVASNLWGNPGLNWTPLYGILNIDGWLVKGLIAHHNFGSPPVSGIILSFDYEVRADAGTIIW